MSIHPMSSIIAGKKIVICGGGMGGLVAAISLRRLCRERHISPLPTIRIFERDASATSRPGQGYAINMRDHGVTVLQKLGLWSQVLDNEAMGGVMIMCDSKFNEWIRLDDGEHAKDTCRIDRAKLRTMLLNQLEPLDDIMVWNKIAVGVDQEAGSDIATVRFHDGTMEHGCHLVIAADGARSKLRAHVAPEEKLNFLGVEMLTGEAAFPSGLPSSISSGTTFAFGPGTSLFIAPMTLRSAVWLLGYNTNESHPEVRTGSMLTSDAALNAASATLAQEQSSLRTQVEEKAHGEYTGIWPRLYAATPSVGRIQALDKLPHGHRGVVSFIGDSCHPVPPYAGNGANMAMMDGWDLADKLTTSSYRTLDDALTAFDRSMIPRATAIVNETRGRVANLYHPRTRMNQAVRKVKCHAFGVIIGTLLRPRRAFKRLIMFIILVVIIYFICKRI